MCQSQPENLVKACNGACLSCPATHRDVTWCFGRATHRVAEHTSRSSGYDIGGTLQPTQSTYPPSHAPAEAHVRSDGALRHPPARSAPPGCCVSPGLTHAHPAWMRAAVGCGSRTHPVMPCSAAWREARVALGHEIRGGVTREHGYQQDKHEWVTSWWRYRDSEIPCLSVATYPKP